MTVKTPEPVEYTHTRIKVAALAKAKKIVKRKSKFASVAHMLEVLIDEEAKKL
jgi:hypothetical protein